jgi:hypothetical protein
VKRIGATLGVIFLGGAIGLAWLSGHGRLGESAKRAGDAVLRQAMSWQVMSSARAGDRGLERAPESKAAGPEKRIALVIGNGAYQRAALTNAPGDAKLMAGVLRKLNFTVLDHYDLNQRDMKQAMRAFGDAIAAEGKDVVAFVYYAGHGIQVKSENYLIPVGESIQSEKDVDLEAIKVSSLMSMLENTETRLNVVVLDACRNNPFQSSRSVGRGGLAQVSAPNGALGSLVAFSTAPDRVALDDSPYATALAQALSEPGLSIDKVFMRVRGVVKTATKDEQVPWEQTSLTDDFFPAGNEAARKEAERKEAELKQREEEQRQKTREAETRLKEAELKQREENLRKRDQARREAALVSSEVARLEAENKQREAEIARLEAENKRIAEQAAAAGASEDAPVSVAAAPAPAPVEDANRFRRSTNAPPAQDNSRFHRFANAAPNAAAEEPADDWQGFGSGRSSSPSGFAVVAYCADGGTMGLQRGKDRRKAEAQAIQGCVDNGRSSKECCIRNLRSTTNGCIGVAVGSGSHWALAQSTQRENALRRAAQRCGADCGGKGQVAVCVQE